MDPGGRYEEAFCQLEIGKKLEKTCAIEEACDSYTRACAIFRDITVAESDQAKKNLLIQQIKYYESKVQNLRFSASALAEANSVLENAVELDEGGKSPDAESLYLQAVEMYLNYLKIIDDSSIRSRVSGILDRVSQMKDTDLSFEKSSPSYLVDLPSVDPRRPLERTLAPSNLPPPSIAAAVAAADTGGESLTAHEISVLRASSVINGKCFMPWMDGEEEREVYSFNNPFVDPDGPLSFSASQVRHHAEYRRISDIVSRNCGQPPVMIRRVSPLSIHQDLVPDCSFVCSLCIAAAYEARLQKQLITGIIFPQNERKVPVYNPSGKYLVKLFVNGVPRKVVIDDFLPVSSRSGRLLCSSSKDPSEIWVSLVEKAYMKLNGGYDFPGSNSGRDLHALTGWIPEQVYFSEDSSESLLSKVGRADHRQSEDRAWERILSAHKFGDCLITISTPTMSEQEEETTGLVSGHSYAVLNVQSAGTVRMLQVKNPWARQTWKGRFSSVDRDTWTPGLRQALNVSLDDFDKMDDHGIFWIEFTDCRRVFKSFFLNWNPSLFLFRSTLHGHWPVCLGPRIDSYYVGDNPQYILRLDGSMGLREGTVSKCNSTRSASASSVWILLSRHISVVEGENSDVSEEDEIFMALHVHRGGERLYAPVSPLVKGIYSSDSHILTRIDISSEETIKANERTLEHPMGKPLEYMLLLSQMDKRKDVSYTLSVYSTVLPFVCAPCPAIPSNQLRVNGSWTERTAGGNTGSSTFYMNPQYRLIINGEKGFDFHIQAMFSKDVCASISVINPRKNMIGKKGVGLSNTDSGRVDIICSDTAEVITSGNYRHGFCYCSTEKLKPGEYVVVLSTYDKANRGPFVLTFATSAGADVNDTPFYNRKYFTVKEIAPEGYGMKRFSCDGEWKAEDETSAGCSNFSNYHKNPLYLLTIPHPATLTCRVKVPETYSVGLNLSIFDGALCLAQQPVDVGDTAAPAEPSNDDGNEVVRLSEIGDQSTLATLRINCSPKNALASSGGGVYVIRPAGASLQNISLQAGSYVVVPSTFDPTCCKYEFAIFIAPTTLCTTPGFSIRRIR